VKDIYTARMVEALDGRIERGGLRDLTQLRPKSESHTD
jgi:hypothetical protein